MLKLKKMTAVILAIVMLLSISAYAAEPKSEALDYGDPASWAYFELGKDKDVDVFLICPTVDTINETNSFDLNARLRASFVNALDMEKGIYEETGRMFSPYYRQMSMNAYRISKAEREKAREIAYHDISLAFRWYLDNEWNGRGLILAGFSQGSDMCLELMKEYFGGDGEEAAALREKLIAVYALGWAVTPEMAEAYPQIVPAQGETDTGVVVNFDCEDGSLSETLVIPKGQTALSINPLNWKTDATAADKKLNAGAVMGTGAEPIPALCGAYIGARGELVVTDVTPSVYPAVIDIFPEGSYHIYDYMFFFNNLKENVAARTTAWRTGMPFKDVKNDAWYKDYVKNAFEKEWINGTSASTFSPELSLSRAQLVTILWRMAGAPVVNYAMQYADVAADEWYTEAVRWAASEKITDMTGSEFRPGDSLQRDEAAFLLWNAAKLLGADVSVGEDTNILSYDDALAVHEGYASAVQWAVGAGVMQGIGQGLLAPRYWLTRAQTAAMLQRMNACLTAE